MQDALRREKLLRLSSSHTETDGGFISPSDRFSRQQGSDEETVRLDFGDEIALPKRKNYPDERLGHSDTSNIKKHCHQKSLAHTRHSLMKKPQRTTVFLQR